VWTLAVSVIEAEGDGGSDGEMRRAGFGKVLYVEPRDV
jgi:hypothetical protein